MAQIEVAAFYQFARLAHFRDLQQPLKALCTGHGVKGITLLAHEGINGTLAGTPVAMRMVMAGIRDLTGLHVLEQKTSYTDEMPFLRLKVRLKAEIVTIGDPSVDPLERVGTYVEPEDWNALISDPDVVLIDTRNSFECDLGTFKGAIDPKTTSFSEFPTYVTENLDPAKHKKVAMFCTGGIRCEKASSYMLGLGFDDVFHLKGGVLNYLERVPADKSLWQGECFIFDKRTALDHDLRPTDRTLCAICRTPLDEAARQSANYEEGVSCPTCSPLQTPQQKASARERQRQIKLAEQRGETHLGPKPMTAE